GLPFGCRQRRPEIAPGRPGGGVGRWQAADRGCGRQADTIERVANSVGVRGLLSLPRKGVRSRTRLSPGSDKGSSVVAGLLGEQPGASVRQWSRAPSTTFGNLPIQVVPPVLRHRAMYLFGIRV